jgi:gamma-glutamylcyclotransferase (GGCT)/AIG2-like uncharacterized protein YtfP
MKLFVYGTLIEKNVQKAILGRVVDMKKARLYEFSLKEAIWGGIPTSYKTIAFEQGKKNSKVDGMIIEVSEAEVKKIDRYESFPKFYKKIRIDVTDDDGTIVECISYINSHYAKLITNS